MRLSKIDYFIAFMAIVVIILLISIINQQSIIINQDKPMYNNKEDKDPNYLRAYEESKEVREKKINEFIKAAQGE